MIYVLHTDSGYVISFYLLACARIYQQANGGWIEAVEQVGLCA
jgi:hypothetical protein